MLDLFSDVARNGQLSCMLIDTEKEHRGPPVRKSECVSPAIGKSQFPFQATLSSISKGGTHYDVCQYYLTISVGGLFASVILESQRCLQAVAGIAVDLVLGDDILLL